MNGFMEFYMEYGLWVILGVCAAGAVLTLLGMSMYNRYKNIKEQLNEAMKKGKPGSAEREAWEKAQKEKNQ